MKQIKLIIASLLLLVGGNVFAQTGTTPYVGSTHTYTVTKGLATGSTLSWTVTDGARGTDFDFVTGTGVVIPVETLVTTESANVLWKVAKDSYTLQLAEENSTSSCITLRQIDVVVGDNNFDIATADLTATCSDASGSVIVNSDNNNLGNTSKTFTIDMSTQADMTTATFIPDWEFEYEITSTSGDLVSVTFDTNATVDVGATLVGKDAAGKVVVNNNDYSITATVVFKNTWNSGDLVTLTLTKGKELSHNTPEKDAEEATNNNTGSVTINAMPATTNITTDN